MAQELRQSAARRRLIMRHFSLHPGNQGACCIPFDLFAYFASFGILRLVLLGEQISVNTLTSLDILDR
jgi:hypothetical protein